MTDNKEQTYDNSTSSRELLDKFGAIVELDNGESEFISITQLLKRNITEIWINRPYELWTEDSNGVKQYKANFSYNDLIKLVNTLGKYNKKSINENHPTDSIRLPDGERGHIVVPPACEPNTVVFAIRKPSDSRFKLADYIKTGRLAGFKDTAEYFCSQKSLSGSLSEQSAAVLEMAKGFRDTSDNMKLPHDIHLTDWQYAMLNAKANGDMATFFKLATENHCNICMVGGTGSGKTTFTKAVADLIDPATRIITIEDTHELDLPNHPNHAHLFYGKQISAKSLIAACMRLKPDRIFLTELRGDEAWDYLSALNTGHAGGLTSVHANDSRSVFYRIAQLAKESETGQRMDYDYILNTVKSTIDIVCFFKRTRMEQLYFDPVAKLQAERGR